MRVDLARLRRHVAQLAHAPRPAESQALRDAREMVAAELTQWGWNIVAEPFTASADTGGMWKGVNLVAVQAARVDDHRPWFCIGAHLDSRPETPGADDNASAVAALLEIARLLPEEWPEDPQLNLELVVFDLEELGMLGGAAHAEFSRAHHRDLRGMVSLEMLGYCDPTPGSQQLPRSLIGQYPDTGDFIAVIGNQISGRLIEQFAAGMRSVDQLPVETLQVPDNGNLLQATRLSDHSPFWDAGYAALMITDTSFLRNPHYHMPSDMPETLDAAFLQRVTEGCYEAVRQILSAGL